MRERAREGGFKEKQRSAFTSGGLLRWGVGARLLGFMQASKVSLPAWTHARSEGARFDAEGIFSRWVTLWVTLARGSAR